MNATLLHFVYPIALVIVAIIGFGGRMYSAHEERKLKDRQSHLERLHDAPPGKSSTGHPDVPSP